VLLVRWHPFALRDGNGFRLAAVGANGRRFGFVVRDSEANPALTREFVDLLAQVAGVRLASALVVPLATGRFLVAVPKNQINLHDMIAACHKNPEIEAAAIREWSGHDWDELGEPARLEVLARVRREFECGHLARALLVTSKSAAAWARRTTEFASSAGAVSALAHAAGTGDTRPDNLLLDKTTARLTRERFFAADAAVPFRLTPVTERSFGRCGVAGPWLRAFRAASAATKKAAGSLAPFLQLFLAERGIPFEFLSRFGDVERPRRPAVDAAFARLAAGPDVETLVAAARNPANHAKMAADWCPWW
jgi:phosphatidylinositol kinase/protein kinase (PI-3  family)